MSVSYLSSIIPNFMKFYNICILFALKLYILSKTFEFVPYSNTNIMKVSYSDFANDNKID